MNSGFIVSIGAGRHQVPFIKKASELGFGVIAVDQNPGAPGFKFADIKVIESVAQYRRIYRTISSMLLSEPVVGIGCRSYGKAVYTASYIAEKLALYSSSPPVVQSFYNKKTMKSFLKEKSVPVPDQFTWTKKGGFKKLEEKVTFPCILKPINSQAKKGIEVIQNKASLKTRIKSIPDPESYLLEEFIEGSEVTVLGFVTSGEFQLVSISDKITTPFSPFLELSHRLPTNQQKYIGELRLLCQTIVSATGLRYAPFVAEFKITDKGKIYLMEAMPEVGGEFLADYQIPEYYNYDYFKNYISLIHQGIVEPVVVRKEKTRKITHISFISPPKGKFQLKEIKEKISAGQDIKVFFEENLIEKKVSIDTESGNAARVKVIGASSGSLSHEELDTIIRNETGAEFEPIE